MADMNIREGLSEKERLRLEKIDKLDENKRRKKVIIAVVTAILCLFFVLGTIFGGMYILSFEGTQELPAEVVEYPALPETEADIYADFTALLQDTKNFAGTKTDISFDVSLFEDSIVINGENADSLLTYLKHIRSSATDKLSACYEDDRHTGAYGEDFSALLEAALFSEQDFTKAEAVVNEENENDLQYVFTFDGCAFDEREVSSVFASFDLAAAEETVTAMKDLFADVVTVGEAALSYEDFVVTAEVDRLAHTLKNFRQTRVCNITLPVTFIGEYADFGTATIELKLELKRTFRFTRVSFSFKDDVYYIEKGSTDELKTSVVTDESPVDVVITFTSSDPSVLSVDGTFYKGEKVSNQPVTVTGTYTYNGVTYTDSCQYWVRVPVEGIKVDTKELTLAKGQSEALTATFSPAEATITTLYWFTSDENIAAVDENGTVTAVAAGETTVYCVTLDGNYKSVCTVTVTE